MKRVVLEVVLRKIGVVIGTVAFAGLIYTGVMYVAKEPVKLENKKTTTTTKRVDEIVEDQSTTTTTTAIKTTKKASNKKTTTEKPVVVPVDKEETKPSVDDKKPVINEEKLTDKIVDKGMVVSGKYSNVIIKSDISENAIVELNKATIVGSLIIEAIDTYMIDIKDSKINTIVVGKEKEVSPMMLRTFGLNKTLEGPTININNNSSVGDITINDSVEIDGEKEISNILVNSGSVVVLDVPSKNLNVKSLDSSSTITLNKRVTSLKNDADAINIVVNSEIKNLENNGAYANIRINSNSVVSTLTNNGDETVISGNGSINTLNVNAEETKVYTKVTKEPVIKDGIVNFTKINSNVTVRAKSTGQGSLTFTLSEVVELTEDDISVICNQGKDITIYSMTTEDKLTYKVSTSIFKNNSYELYITLPEGGIISTSFKTEYDVPTVSKAEVKRISGTEAALELYGVDEGGKVYYVLEEKENNKLTKENIKENGKNTSIKTGYNKITLSSLEKDKKYYLYYVMEGYYSNVSGVEELEIDVFQEQEENKDPEEETKYTITYAKEERKNYFVFKLNKAPTTELTIFDFKINCPTGSDLTLDEATLTIEDNGLMYIIEIPENYGHYDNNYEVEININGNKVKKEFEVNLNPPRITGETVTWEDENTVKLSFFSDKAGKVYYGIFEYNGVVDVSESSVPKATDILDEKIESFNKNLDTSKNEITIDVSSYEVTNKTRIWALFVDEVGNYRVGLADHYTIPEKEVQKPTESTLKVKELVPNANGFDVTFTEPVQSLGESNIVISGKDVPNKMMLIVEDLTNEKTKFSISFDEQDLTFINDEEYTIKFTVKDNNNLDVTEEKTFTFKN